MTDSSSETTNTSIREEDSLPLYQNSHQRALRILEVVEPLALVLVPLILATCAYFAISATALFTALVAAVAVVPFFARFELMHPRPRDIMPIVVMSALGVAGRLIFAPVPAIKPVGAIVIVTAIAFGRQSGFLTGALIMLVSNIFFGQGPWTPWQMYCFGLMGYLAGVLADRGIFDHPAAIFIYGFIATYGYGFILDTWTLVGFVKELTWTVVLTTYGVGLVYNTFHAVGTLIFLMPIAVSWPRKFERIKRKYGLGKGTQQLPATPAAINTTDLTTDTADSAKTPQI